MYLNSTRKNLTLPILLLLLSKGVFAQKTDSNAYDSLSLKELLGVKIVSVSKTSELLFDAPLSASVLTKEEIKRSGATSIMEALRLVPGLIVREQSNGNFDIALRGLDNMPPNASFDIISSTTLVMIDSRPIYSYLRGGTFWETLPIDINDVEKIEVVRGPAAALYGPNAVNGVINLITRKIKKEGFYFLTNNQMGIYRGFINNASVGYKGKKINAIVSGNYQHRHRSQTSYFEYWRNDWFEHPDFLITFQGDTVRNINARYPDQAQGLEKFAGNLFVNYDIAKDVNIDLSTGAQNSVVQKISAENEITPLSNATSRSRYLDLRAKLKSFNAQLSMNKGIQNVDYDPGNKYDFNTIDASMEYNYSVGNLSLKPGVSYRKAIYDDTKYSDTAAKRGIFNAEGKITTLSATLRSEYRLIDDRLRVVAGVAANKFNYPNETILSYQGAATFKISAKHLLRVVASRAPRSSNIFDTYVNQTIAYFPAGPQKYMHMILRGNKNLELFTANLLEFGYRGKLSKQWSVDVELFHIRAKDVSVQVTSKSFMEMRGSDTVVITPIAATNLPLKAFQNGLTLTLNYSSKRIQVKPFVTIQHSHITDYAPYPYTADAGYGPYNIYSGIGTTTHLESTPAVFGGAYFNYAFNSKFNMAATAYFYSSQYYYHLSNVLLNDGVRGIDHLAGKILLNISASYQPINGFRIFCSGKNLMNDTSREFFKTDRVPFSFYSGFSWEL